MLRRLTILRCRNLANLEAPFVANAFNLFVADVRPGLLASKEGKAMTKQVVGVHLSAMWREMPEKRRNEYRAKADELNFGK